MSSWHSSFSDIRRIMWNQGRSRIILLIGIPVFFYLGVQLLHAYVAAAKQSHMSAEEERQRLARFVQHLVPHKEDAEKAIKAQKQELASELNLIPVEGTGNDMSLVIGGGQRKLPLPDQDADQILDLDAIRNSGNALVNVPQEQAWEMDQQTILKFSDRSMTRYTNINDMPSPPFLHGYRNPCWKEDLFHTPRFTDSYYFTHSDASHQRYFHQREKYWNDEFLNSGRKRLRCFPFFFVVGTPDCDAAELFSQIQINFRIIKGHHRKSDWWGGLRFQYLEYKGGNITRLFVPISHYLDLMDEAAQRIKEEVKWSGGEEVHSLILGEASDTLLTDVPGWKRLPENLQRSENDGPWRFEANYMNQIHPDAKFIFILRNPTKRLYLEYQHKRDINHSAIDFHRHCAHAVNEMRECLRNHSPWACVFNKTIIERRRIQLRHSMYYVFLRRWLEVYDKQQVFLLKTEEFRNDPIRWINKCLQFLGFGDISPNQEQRIKVPKEQEDFNDMEPMLNQTKTLLDDFFSYYNKRLTELLGDEIGRFLWK